MCIGGSVLATDRIVGGDSLPVHLREVNCVGTESDINECPQDDSHTCLNPGAGVICPVQVNGCLISIIIFDTAT